MVASVAIAVGVERDADRERLLREVVLVLAGGGEQLGVAAERELDPVLDLEAAGLARVLDRVHDLAREALAPQLVVELELERHRVRALALELVALERLHGEQQVVGAELVIVAVDAIPTWPPSRSASATCPGSSAATAAATCGICLPKRGPSER